MLSGVIDLLNINRGPLKLQKTTDLYLKEFN